MVVPSGTCTSRSRMARRMRQRRPTLTCENKMLESTSEYEFTRTSGESTEFLTIPPETMQPLETMESTAVPVRPLSAKTNLAGGYWRWGGRVGQGSSYRVEMGETATLSIFAS